MGFWDNLSDPANQNALLGFLNGAVKAAAPTRIPMGWGQSIGMMGQGALQGKLQDYPDYQLKQQEVAKGGIGLQQQLDSMDWMRHIQGLPPIDRSKLGTPMGFSGLTGTPQPMALPAPSPQAPAPQAPAPMSPPPGAMLPATSTMALQAAPASPAANPFGLSQDQLMWLIRSDPSGKALANVIEDKAKGHVIGRAGKFVSGTGETIASNADPNQPLNADGSINQAFLNAKAAEAANTERAKLAPDIQNAQIGLAGSKSAAEASAGARARLAPDIVAAEANLAGQRKLAETTAEATGIPIDHPAVQATKDQVYSGSLDLRNVPVGLRTPTIMAMDADAKQADAELKDPRLPPAAILKQSQAAKNIASGYVNTTEYKLAIDGLPYVAKIKAALAQKPSSVGDAELLDSMVKLSNSGNAVTEAQVKLITGGASLSDWLHVTAGRLGAQGGVLSPSQRDQIAKLSDATYDNYQKAYQPMYNELAGKLTDLHINKKLWPIPDFGKLAEQARQSFAAPAAGPATGSATPPQAAIQALKMYPGKAAEFDSKFGAGASKQYLGQ